MPQDLATPKLPAALNPPLHLGTPSPRVVGSCYSRNPRMTDLSRHCLPFPAGLLVALHPFHSLAFLCSRKEWKFSRWFLLSYLR